MPLRLFGDEAPPTARDNRDCTCTKANVVILIPETVGSARLEQKPILSGMIVHPGLCPVRAG